MDKKIMAKLYSASGVGVESKLLFAGSLSVYNYPELIMWGDKTFIQTPVLGEYREVSAYRIPE